MLEWDETLEKWSAEIEAETTLKMKEIDHISEWNQIKVLKAFQKHHVSDFHFSDSTGYGYDDRGREVLDEIYADIFGAEAALVRPHFASGTHTISTALFGVLRHGDRMVSLTGRPYDTLHKVIGSPGDGIGSLADWGIAYDEVALLADGSVDWEQAAQKITADTKVVAIQRSRGYDWRPSFTVEQIAEMVRKVREIRPEVIIFVDNCYGEFTEKLEPTEVGVDLMAGSLIKNPGGGLAASGGYIVGKKRYVELSAYRLTAPGIGGEVGAMLGTTRSLYQGLFLAPLIVGQAVKGAVFAAALFARLGFVTRPEWSDPRTDLIQAVRFDSAEQLISFVQSIQKAAPIDSYVLPEPSEMPGYEHPVIMAAGTFIQGGSLELSADGPVREPYIAFMQGGLTYAHVKYAVLEAARVMVKQLNR